MGTTFDTPAEALAAADARARAGWRRVLPWLLAAALPPAVFAVLLAAPSIDQRLESQPAHFWLVLAAATASVILGLAVGAAARRRRDARLFLISLAFVAAAGFLGLHALATPGVLLGKNGGFELATPFGLVLAGVLAAASSLELRRRAAATVLRLAPALLATLLALMALWAVVSLVELWPLRDPVAGERLDGWQSLFALVGIFAYAAAAIGYFRLYRRRRSGFLLAVAFGFALLAEAMIVTVWARNWQLSWWEWHVLMLGAFVVIAASAWTEWPEERFSALYLEETLAGAKEVSILFADLAGFTGFVERSSPGEVATMLNAYLDRIVPLMEAAGGEVHEIVGDQLVVIFNRRGDQPDHAVRAARAALRLQGAAAEVEGAHPHWPHFRVGVSSGEVLATVVGGHHGYRKYGVIGDTVNLGARLQQTAPVDGIVIGEGTFRRLPAGAVAERLPPVALKGKSERVEAYVLRELAV
jgi:adenylate cyclase